MITFMVSAPLRGVQKSCHHILTRQFVLKYKYLKTLNIYIFFNLQHIVSGFFSHFLKI